MKRILTMALMLLMAVSVFASCGRRDESPSSVSESTAVPEATSVPSSEAPATEVPSTEPAATEEPTPVREIYAGMPGKTFVMAGGLILAVFDDGTVGAYDTATSSDPGAFDEWRDIVSISSNGEVTLGLRSDGAVVFAGLLESAENTAFSREPAFEEQINSVAEKISLWNDIADVEVGPQHIAALHSDGKVSVLSISFAESIGTGTWNDIVEIALSTNNIYGIDKYGRLFASGRLEDPKLPADKTHAVSIVTDDDDVHVLRSDGTVVSTNKEVSSKVKGWTDIRYISANSGKLVGVRSDGTVLTSDPEDILFCGTDKWTDIAKVYCGDEQVVGLKNDGTLTVSDTSHDNLGTVQGWHDITAIAGSFHDAFGLRSDGTVVSAGMNSWNNGDVSDWTDIVAISAGDYHTVGLRSDGTVVTTIPSDGDSGSELLRKVEEWTDIAAVYAGNCRTIGIKKDGTVLFAGISNVGDWDDNGDFIMPDELSNWKNIVSVSSNNSYIFGVRSNGKAVSLGYDDEYTIDVSRWKDVVAVSAYECRCMGLRKNGTVYIEGDVEPWSDDEPDFANNIRKWQNISMICCSWEVFAGLRKDGTVAAEWTTSSSSYDISDWRDITFIACTYDCVLGLRADGTVVGSGIDGFSALPVMGWSGIMTSGR